MFSRHWNDHSSGRKPESSRTRRNDSRHSRHTKEPRSEPSRHINIIDLDAVRLPYVVSIKPSSTLNSITSYLRAKYSDGPEKIPEDASIRFFSGDGQELQGDGLPSSLTTIRYRVLEAGDDGSFRFRWGGRSNSRWIMSDSQLNSLIPLVQKGCSIGSLRQSIKEVINQSDTASSHPIEDPNQIVIEAVGGIRPGPLQGNNWEAEKISVWLSRCFQIDVRSHKNYFVFKGFNEEYVWHKPEINRRGRVASSSLKKWLKDSVLNTVHLPGSHRQRVDVDDIRLSHNGHATKSRSEFSPGRSFSFELPRKVGDSYIEAESWLVPTTESCIICTEDKRVSEMPHRRRITKACSHDANMCKECVAQWITSSLETLRWDRLKCPECPQLLKFENVRAFATEDTFKRYDELATKGVLTQINEFQWCLNPQCNSGQIHSKGCTKARCHACHYTWCAHHNVPWHRKETCQEYDHRNRDHRRDDRLSEKKVKDLSKQCPGCQGNVHKYDGCDHITCVCGCEWCWECRAQYYKDGNGRLLCRHEDGCRSEGNPRNWPPELGMAMQADPWHNHRWRQENHAPRLGTPLNHDRMDRFIRRAVNRNPFLNADLTGPDQPRRQWHNFAGHAANFNFANMMRTVR
ncbi:hypothetical protein F4809DRAFT_216014 [Biscogniauxia mediterranea]|nr:hypothetical protein F4809DRAFT_216014 [Biscogniauxia mediterranea]